MRYYIYGWSEISFSCSRNFGCRSLKFAWSLHKSPEQQSIHFHAVCDNCVQVCFAAHVSLVEHLFVTKYSQLEEKYHDSAPIITKDFVNSMYNQ